ncbi:MAG: polyphosphate polymerase domain-containing protein [Myxococcota bacterium]
MRPFRQELKFLIHYSVRELLLSRWSQYLVRAPFTDANAVTPILSQYYDSPELTFYWEKLDGIALRNKVRIRTYGHHFKAGETTFLEIKHRSHDLVRKYRYLFPEFEEGLLDPGLWKIEDPKMESAFMILLERYRLRASAQTYYQREAYEGLIEKDVRVTFDTILLGLHPNERLSPKILHDPGRRLMADTLAILELKSTKGFPPWIYEGIVAGELQQKTIPKYVTAVEVLRLPETNAGGIYA